jgi:hypothetical protein
MTDKLSLFKLLGLPEPFGVVLLTISFVLFLAPFLSGKDFGVIIIPEFKHATKKRLKKVGPIVFIICLLLFFPLIPIDHKSSDRATRVAPGSQENESVTTYPPEDQVRKQIDVALQRGEIGEAIQWLDKMRAGPGREEECGRLFSYSIKNQEMDAAERLVGKCWKGKKGEEARKEIEHQRLKKSSSGEAK